MALTEALLEGVWAVDPVKGTRLAAFRYHHERHGPEVGAADEEQYLRKAIEFARTKRGHSEPVYGSTPGVRRWWRANWYIDVTPENEIVSFGTVE